MVRSNDVVGTGSMELQIYTKRPTRAALGVGSTHRHLVADQMYVSAVRLEFRCGRTTIKNNLLDWQ